jgi:anti-sigma factor RsiW
MVFNDNEMKESDCNEINLRLGRFHDGELEAEQAALVEQHLRTCEDCARAVERLRNLDRLLDQDIPERALDRDLLDAIGRDQAAGWWLRAAAAAAIPLALGAIAGGLLFNGQVETEPEGVTIANLIEESFGPGSLHGFDDLARDLEPEAEGEQ